MFLLRVILALLTLSFTLAAQAQRTVEKVALAAQDSSTLQVKRTTLWAACLPGSGQIVNRQFWKVPVIWGGMGYATWATVVNAREMRANINDLIALTDDNPNTEPVLVDANGNFYSAAQLESRAMFYRRNRDLSIISLLLAHGLQVLDANTGAMLRNLDTSESLSFRGGAMWGVPTIHVTWNFNRHDP